MSQYKQFITFDRSLCYNATDYSITNAFDERKYKLFNPLVFDPPKNFIEYKNGKNWVIATKISIQRYLNQMNDQEIQEEVKQK